MPDQTPTYPLSKVIEAAEKGNINLDRRASRDANNLGYSTIDGSVDKCLCSLIPTDYYKTIPEPAPTGGLTLYFDVYKTKHEGPKGNLDRLYIKLRLSAGNWITVGSFKQE